ncbi:uncharacterized protein PV07_05957 [Cladophialophora immunda]|uniref:Uncharacterized protein n=1 Tax=Cladophialophora immunda TaxID=569365 RepID=A0A0D2AY15_9EURO|nr:uncharacterized protein PV07_05957 [Cladophialophora immunda]KIW30197.1 hypothetical protein PV07_05957 [Cladophialophora immunda]
MTKAIRANAQAAAPQRQQSGLYSPDDGFDQTLTADRSTGPNYPACATLISTDSATIYTTMGSVNFASQWTVAYCDVSSYVLAIEYTYESYVTATTTIAPAGVTFTFAPPTPTNVATTTSIAQSTSTSAALRTLPSRLLLYTISMMGLFGGLH